MGANRRLGWALLVSLLAHAAFWWRLPEPETVRTVARFDVELTARPTPEATPELIAEPPPAPVSRAAPDVPDLPDHASGESASDGTDVVEPLDLNLPSDWDEIVRTVDVPDGRLAFVPEFGRALKARARDGRRSWLTQQRSSAVYGVADPAYSRSGPLGEELKRDGACMRLVEDRDVEEGQRWWASTCTETRQNPFTLPAVEYDALGRALVD